MKRLMEKSVILLLALAMILSVAPVQVPAAEDPEPAGQTEYPVEPGTGEKPSVEPDPKQTEEPEAADGSINETAELMAGSVPINDKYFSPVSFRTFVLSLDENSNFTLDPSESETVETIAITCKKDETQFSGLQYFPALKSLEIEGGTIETLDVSGLPKLETLFCTHNNLKTLVVGNHQNLERLTCNYSGLSSLDVSGCPNLVFLDCSYNSLTSLNISNCPQLTRMKCEHNELVSLDLSKCIKLNYLDCSENNLKTLNTANLSSLTKILCSDTSLTSLDLSKNKNLKELECHRSNLSSLNVSGCSALADLRLAANDLASLDLKACTALKVLCCEANKLTSLDLSSNKNLEALVCYHNNIAKLQLPIKEDGSLELQTLDCSENPLDSLGTNTIHVLFKLDCSRTNLSGDLNVSMQLPQILRLQDTKLTSLTISTPAKPSPILLVFCNQNDLLRTVTIVPGTAIKDLHCSDNPQLKSLDVSAVTERVDCCYNDLSSLTGVRCSKLLETYGNPNLRSVDLRGSEVMRSLVYNGPQETGTSKDSLKTPYISYGDGMIKMDLRTAPVIGDSLEEITVITPPKKTDYLVGETFDPAGMEVQAAYTSGRQRTVYDYVYSRPITEDTAAAVIGYTESGVTRTTVQPVTVLTFSGTANLPEKSTIYTALNPVLTGNLAKLADAGKLQYQWERYQFLNGGFFWFKIDGATSRSYAPDVVSRLVNRYRVRITAEGFDGEICSNEVTVEKKKNYTSPVDPDLEGRNEEVWVKNAQTNQEYLITQEKLEFEKLNWSTAVFPLSNGELKLGGKPGENWVYTRIREIEDTQAGPVRRVGILLDKKISINGVSLSVYGESGSYYGGPGYYSCDYGQILRIRVNPVPANASDFLGVKGMNWSISPSRCGTLYEDDKCTMKISPDKWYKTVFAKLTGQANDVEITAAYTLENGTEVSDSFVIDVRNEDGDLLLEEVRVSDISLHRGEKGYAPFSVEPAAADVNVGGNCYMTVTPESGAPSLHVWNADFSVVVDASDAQQGTYTVTFRNRHTSAELGRFLVTVLPPEIWTVRFDPNGGSGSMPDMTVERAKKSLRLPACDFTPPAGKEFDTWDVGQPLTYAEITGDTTVRAVWKDREIPQYTVRFDPGSGSGNMADARVQEGSYTLPECAFTPPTGYEFDRWSVGRPGTSVDISSDTILYALWLPKTYTVQFDAGEGTGYMAGKTAVYGESFTLPACSFKAPFGKVFDRWDLGKAGSSVTLTGNTVVKALWKNSFTVTSAAVSAGRKVTVTNSTASPASVRVIAAAYDTQGRFVSSALSDKKLDAGKNASVTIPYAAKDKVITIKVFVLNPDTMAPLTAAWTEPVAS